MTDLKPIVCFIFVDVLFMWAIGPRVEVCDTVVFSV